MTQHATPESIRADYDRTVTRIRARQDLSAQARQVSIARAYNKAQEQMAQVQQADTARYNRQRQFLERKLFGNTGDINGSQALSSRDARERAAKLSDAREATAAFERAKRDGDTDFARAIAAHAADQAAMPIMGDAWQPIVQQYAESSPAKADTYNELASMRQPGTGMDFQYVVPSPSELGRLTAAQVTQLASSDLTVYGNDAA
ncbi:hypothetical protein [Streptomyces antimycoticus]